MAYRHLTTEERSQISLLLSMEWSQKKIASQLKRAPSTISRELSRNAGPRGYSPEKAHKKTVDRRRLASSTPKKMKALLLARIQKDLLENWSPEQIAGRLAREEGLQIISHEAIYSYVWRDKNQGGQLYRHLRHSGKKYNKRSAGKAGRGCIPNRVDISERPAIVARKERLGDGEVDTVMGANHKGAILTLVDRKSKFTLAVNLKGKTAKEVNKRMLSRFKRLLKEYPRFDSFNNLVRTLTFDNGKAFSGHESIAQALGAKCYFARPYHSWERGLNEHTNGLLRQYYPKQTSFTGLSNKKTHWIENRLNNRPRKALNYLTPIEVMMGKKCPALVALRA